MINGEHVMCQRFMSILCPLNAATIPLKGAQDTLPFIGTMTSFQVEEEQIAHMESEDLQSIGVQLVCGAGSIAAVFCLSKKVDGAAFRLEAGTLVRPALAVIPMGWHSAVGLVQEAVRTLAFERSKVPRTLTVVKGLPLPASDTKAIVYTTLMRSIWCVGCLRTSQSKVKL